MSHQCQNSGVQYGESCIPDKRCCKQTIIILVIVIALMVLTAGIVVGALQGGLVAASANSRSRSMIRVPLLFSPGDTRIMSFGSFFCDEITLGDNSTRTEATAYLITDAPPLTLKNSFTISSALSLRFAGRQSYHYWNYYLYPGSNFTTSLRVTFFIIVLAPSI